MSVKPIDLQTNISQMHEVAKNEGGRSAALVQGQNVMEKESGEKSRLVNSRLEENKKLEKTEIKREEKNKKRGKGWSRSNKEDEEIEGKGETYKDERLGTVIDVRK
ncbi:MAG: hypothetical protein SVZ03_08445 [Spirochaetota bacterium]|nr:hypothetical protein [Spirochaetota bacterium]